MFVRGREDACIWGGSQSGALSLSLSLSLSVFSFCLLLSLSPSFSLSLPLWIRCCERQPLFSHLPRFIQEVQRDDTCNPAHCIVKKQCKYSCCSVLQCVAAFSLANIHTCNPENNNPFQVHINIYIWTYMNIYIYIYMHAYIYIYTYIYDREQ